MTMYYTLHGSGGLRKATITVVIEGGGYDIDHLLQMHLVEALSEAIADTALLGWHSLIPPRILRASYVFDDERALVYVLAEEAERGGE